MYFVEQQLTFYTKSNCVIFLIKEILYSVYFEMNSKGLVFIVVCNGQQCLQESRRIAN